MSGLHFVTGLMKTGKSARLLIEMGQNKSVLLVTTVDRKDEDNKIKSRLGIGAKNVILWNEGYLDFTENISTILVDEAQFLTRKQVHYLNFLSCSIRIVCFGLRTDKNGELFEASRVLMAFADTIEVLRSPMCDYGCGMIAKVNVKLEMNKSDVESDYGAVCLDCFGQIEFLEALNGPWVVDDEDEITKIMRQKRAEFRRSMKLCRQCEGLVTLKCLNFSNDMKEKMNKI